MTRRHLFFDCEGAQLAGTLDEGEAQAGLLIVSGGNEVRAGAFAGQAQLAARIAAEGYPVFRFDRRGVGDSEGPNGEFASSGPDIAAALAAFRSACPAMTRTVGFGNCDAASALMLAQGAGLDGLILSNPWTFDQENSETAPPRAVRAHYRRRLSDPAAIRRLLGGGVSLRQLFSGLGNALRPAPPASSLAQDMAAGIAPFAGPVLFLVAERDRTGQAFLAQWRSDDARIRVCRDATHGYVEPHARDWLADRALEMLRG